MKTYNGNNRQERRRKRTIIPLFYFFAELTLFWLILSIINVSFNITIWGSWSYIASLIIFAYLGDKTLRVYKRQKNLKIA